MVPTVSTFYKYADMGDRGHFGVLASLLFKLLPYSTVNNEQLCTNIVSMNTCFKLPGKWKHMCLWAHLKQKWCVLHLYMSFYAEWVGCWGATWKLNHRVNLCDSSTSYPTGTGGKLIHLSVTKQVKLPTNTGSSRSNQLLSLKWLTHLPLVPHICGSKSRQHWLSLIACRLIGAKPLSEPMLVLLSTGGHYNR